MIITPGHPHFHIHRRHWCESVSTPIIGVEGWYTCRAIKPDVGVVRELSFPNLITNLGMDAIGSTPQFTRMHLGTGTTPPAFTDTALTSFGVNVSNSPVQVGSGNSGAPDYYSYATFQWTSTVGGATGVWTEIGISNQNTTGNLRSHALILDGMGSPTSFPVLADEQFQGTYEFRLYPPSGDSAATITLSGASYDTIYRALDVSNGSNGVLTWQPRIGQTVALASHNTSVSLQGWTGNLNPWTSSSPQGSNLSGATTGTTAAYSTSSYFLDTSYRAGSGSLVGNIRTLKVSQNSGIFQCQYDPVIAKLTTQELIHWQRTTWARV